mmetsp:Transcript_57238/g.186067  ORF Transcript_57238/g.186067 Transcript_57238/m.186067 type:complete len:258 (+) Transcript_57238:1282-2055(+)
MSCGTSRRLCPSSGGSTEKISPPFAEKFMVWGQTWPSLLADTFTIRTWIDRLSRRHCRRSGTSILKSSFALWLTAAWCNIPWGSTTALRGSISLKRQSGQRKTSGRGPNWNCSWTSQGALQWAHFSGLCNTEAAGEPAARSPAPMSDLALAPRPRPLPLPRPPTAPPPTAPPLPRLPLPRLLLAGEMAVAAVFAAADSLPGCSGLRFLRSATKALMSSAFLPTGAMPCSLHICLSSVTFKEFSAKCGSIPASPHAGP